MLPLRASQDSALRWIGAAPYFIAHDGTQWRLQDLLLVGQWTRRVTPGHHGAHQRTFVGANGARVYTFRDIDTHDVTLESLDRQFRESVPE
jgi:hypothetical protein